MSLSALDIKDIQGSDDIEPIPLDFLFTSEVASKLKLRGASGRLFAGRKNEFDVIDCALRMRPNVPNMRRKTMGVERQLKGLRHMLDDPFAGQKTMGVGSFPTDLYAQMVALNIMRNAMMQQTSSKFARPKQPPLWHRVYGGFKDQLIDARKENQPCFLVLSNIDKDSTAQKVEKVRDILEIYADVPKVVITSGCDPMWFFANRLHMPLDRALYLGHVDRLPDADLLDL